MVAFSVNLQFFAVNFSCDCFAFVKFKVNEQNFVTVVAITQQSPEVDNFGPNIVANCPADIANLLYFRY